MPTLLLAGLLVACGSSDRPSAGPGTTTGVLPSVYFVSDAPGWTSRQARNPRPDDPVTGRSEPTLDWFAEYERHPDPRNSQSVRLSGHDVAVARLQQTLAGFDLWPRTARGLDALAGSGPDGPRIVLLPVAPGYTVMALSHDLSLDELVAWVGALEAVGEPEWVARGGVLGR